MQLFETWALPNGSSLPNRLAKAAMEENMATLQQAPSPELIRLYQAWAQGGVGLIITGNVMVDSRAMTGAGGVVLEDDSQLALFAQWARTAQAQGAQMWMQINHPGRQMPSNMGQTTYAPSAVALQMGSLSNMFATPVAMTEAHIHEVIARFANTAALAEQAGFDGVEIHAAHGYLLSQFLSPLTNLRQDQWGGSLHNRARLLLEIVRAIRARVAPRFAVAVKLNSADFQRGGFSTEDAQQVVALLNDLAVDLVELSGGSYETPAMQGQSRDGRTLAREAYFLEFAQHIATTAKMPLMVTGGIRRLAIAEQVVAGGVAMVGMATALAIAPDLPIRWQHQPDFAPALKPMLWRNKRLAALANMATVKYQLQQWSLGKPSKPNIAPAWALLRQQLFLRRRTRQYRQYIAQKWRHIGNT